MTILPSTRNLPTVNAVRIALFTTMLLLSVACASAQTFAPTGNMAQARHSHTETQLPGGIVLIAGGGTDGRSAELYDTASGTFSATGSLNFPRFGHTATLLPDGKVLVRGGSNACFPPAPAELYDPATGVFTATTSSSLKCDTQFATATLLTNGKVLVVGGSTQMGPSPAAELYDHATDTYSSTGSLTGGYSPFDHSATLLQTGNVLVAGGDNFFNGTGATYATAELYDPVAGTFSAPFSMNNARAGHTATLLSDGSVLMTGGYFHNCCGLPITAGFGDQGVRAANEIFRPAKSAFFPAADLKGARYYHTATTLRDGRVLIAGGANLTITGGVQSGGPAASAELYDPAKGDFSLTGSMNAARANHNAALLDSGSVLVTGGRDAAGNDLDSAELYTPPAGSAEPGKAHASPLSISFGTHLLGSTSATRVAVITNPRTNKAPIIIGLLSTGTAEFVIDPARTTCVAGLSLPRGRNCRVGIHFAPTVTGPQTDTLVVTDNASNGPHQVQLKGAGK